MWNGGDRHESHFGFVCTVTIEAKNEEREQG
jgi:hypothetical protein